MAILALQWHEEVLEAFADGRLHGSIAQVVEHHVVILIDEHHHLPAHLLLGGMEDLRHAQAGASFRWRHAILIFVSRQGVVDKLIKAIQISQVALAKVERARKRLALPHRWRWQ